MTEALSCFPCQTERFAKCRRYRVWYSHACVATFMFNLNQLYVKMVCALCIELENEKLELLFDDQHSFIMQFLVGVMSCATA